MSQSRTRKAPAASEAGRSRGLMKASGDSGKTQPQHVKPKSQPEQNQRHSSKSRIPKSIRYDLEHALVGLCDVWFEDIKPHLLRNNIKVHVSPGTGETAAGGDRGRLPPGAPGCSHFNPGAASDHQRRRGASSAVCSSTRPAASRARSRKPRVPAFKLHLSPPPPSPETLDHHHSYAKDWAHSSQATPTAPRVRWPLQRRPQSATVLPRLPSDPVVPRLCRTNINVPRPYAVRNSNSSISSCVMSPLGKLLTDTQLSAPHKNRSILKRQKEMLNRATQTDGPPLWRRPPFRCAVPNLPTRWRSPSPRRPQLSPLPVSQRQWAGRLSRQRQLISPLLARQRQSSSPLPSRQIQSISPLPARRRQSSSTLPARQRQSISPLPARRRQSISSLPARQRQWSSPLPARQKQSSSPLPARRRQSKSPLPASRLQSIPPLPLWARGQTLNTPLPTRRQSSKLPARRHQTTIPRMLGNTTFYPPSKRPDIPVLYQDSNARLKKLPHYWR